MVDLIEICKTLVNYCDEGDLMSALSYFEGEIKPNLDSIDSSANPELSSLLLEAADAVNEEEWATALELVDKIGEKLNG